MYCNHIVITSEGCHAHNIFRQPTCLSVFPVLIIIQKGLFFPPAIHLFTPKQDVVYFSFLFLSLFLSGLKEMGVVNHLGLVNAFNSCTYEFMSQSIPITNTVVHEIPAPLPRIISGGNIAVGGSTFTVLKKLAAGGFATIYQVVSSQRPMEQKKVLKVCRIILIAIHFFKSFFHCLSCV